MTELILERNERLELRAQAHHLQPRVLLGASGFTDAVLKEFDRALADHGLVKVHVPSDEREEREEIYQTVADKLGAAKIQMIGKMLVFWRPPVDKETREKAEEAKVRQPAFNLRAKADPGAKGIKKPGESTKSKRTPKTSSGKITGRKGARPVIKARRAKRVTKNAALAKS